MLWAISLLKFRETNQITPRIPQYIATYFEKFHPTFPFLHKPTFDITSTQIPLLQAVACLGAVYDAPENDYAVSKTFFKSGYEFLSAYVRSVGGSPFTWPPLTTRRSNEILRVSRSYGCLKLCSCSSISPCTVATMDFSYSRRRSIVDSWMGLEVRLCFSQATLRSVWTNPCQDKFRLPYTSSGITSSQSSLAHGELHHRNIARGMLPQNIDTHTNVELCTQCITWIHKWLWRATSNPSCQPWRSNTSYPAASTSGQPSPPKRGIPCDKKSSPHLARKTTVTATLSRDQDKDSYTRAWCIWSIEDTATNSWRYCGIPRSLLWSWLLRYRWWREKSSLRAFSCIRILAMRRIGIIWRCLLKSIEVLFYKLSWISRVRLRVPKSTRTTKFGFADSII